jgi:hypothetical protein
MRAFITLLASRKALIVLLLLAVVLLLPSLAGEKTSQNWVLSLSLHRPFSSIPMLILGGLFLLHLLLKPLAWLLNRRKRPSFGEEEEAVGGSLSEAREVTPVFAQSHHTTIVVEEVETLAPLQNLRSLLQMLRFRIEGNAKEEDESESTSLRASQGNLRGAFLLSLALGLGCFFAAWIYQSGFYPTRVLHLGLGEASQSPLSPQAAPLKTWLHTKLSLLDSEPLAWPKSGMPRLMALRYLPLEGKHERISKDRRKRLEARLELLTNLRSIEIKDAGSSRMAFGKQALLFFEGEQTSRLLQRARVAHTQELLWRFERVFHEITLRDGEKKLTLRDGEEIALGQKGKLRFLGIYLLPAKDGKEGLQPNALLHYKNEKETKVIRLGFTDSWRPEQLISTPWKLQEGSLPDISLAVVSFRQGVQLHLQRREGIFLFWLGLFLFLVGFFGAWWRPYYRIEAQWSRATNLLRIEGSGLGADAAHLAQGIGRSLYFPISWVVPPSRGQGNRPSSALSSSSHPTSLSSPAKPSAATNDSFLASTPQSSTPSPKKSATPPVPPAPSTSISASPARQGQQPQQQIAPSSPPIPPNPAMKSPPITSAPAPSSLQQAPLFFEESPSVAAPLKTSPTAPAPSPRAPSPPVPPTPPASPLAAMASSAPLGASASPPKQTPSASASTAGRAASASLTKPSPNQSEVAPKAPSSASLSTAQPFAPIQPSSPAKPLAASFAPSPSPLASAQRDKTSSPPLTSKAPINRSTAEFGLDEFLPHPLSPATLPDTDLTEKTSISQRPDLSSLQAPSAKTTPKASPPSPLDVDSLFGDILTEPTQKSPLAKAPKAELDIDALFDNLHDPKKK